MRLVPFLGATACLGILAGCTYGAPAIATPQGPSITAATLSGSCEKDVERIAGSYMMPSVKTFFEVLHDECKTGDFITFPANGLLFAVFCNPSLPMRQIGYRYVGCTRDNTPSINARIHKIEHETKHGSMQ